MKAKISWDEIEVQENIGQTLVKILMLKGEKGDTGTTDYNDLLNKPTKLSDFTNDGVFITNAVNDLTNYYLKSDTYTQSEVNNLISVIPKFAIAVVNSLPTQDISTTTIYLVPSTSETTDMYKEYIYVNNAWELLGIQKADLTNYYTKSETDTLLSAKANTSALSTVATSGSYTDLTNKPTIPTTSDIIDTVYPVGSIYMSVSSTSPQTLFGGTWEQIEDKFLLSAGTTYTAGNTGGSATHTLTTGEIPTHSHTRGTMEIQGSFVTRGTNYNNAAIIDEDNALFTQSTASYNMDVLSQENSSQTGHKYDFKASNVWTGSTSEVGSGSAHNNMPPYLVVYVWKRTA